MKISKTRNVLFLISVKVATKFAFKPVYIMYIFDNVKSYYATRVLFTMS